MRQRHTAPFVLFALTLSAFALSGCGITGSLKTPPPLWTHGDDAQGPEENAAETLDEDLNEDLDAELDEEDPGYGIDRSSLS